MFKLTLKTSAFYLLFAFFTISPAFGQTKIQFDLKQAATTSAGAYAPDGTLLRTLWRGVAYPAGPQTATWDGKDDQGNALPAGSYEMRVLSHNISYVWDGAIGNTSAAQSGPRVYQGYLPVRDMAATDTAMYYVMGYNEKQYILHRFAHANPRAQASVGRTDPFTAVSLLDADATNVYLANNEGGVGAGSRTTFVYAHGLADDKDFVFSQGQEVRLNGNYPSQYYQSVVDLDQNSVAAPLPAGLSNAATGLAVQRNGPVLAVAHRGLNVIRLFDKTTGRLLRSLPTLSPGSLSMTPAGDLWAVVGTGVVRFTNLTTIPTVAAILPGLVRPLAVGTDPTNEDVVLVADGGGSQQVKAFSRTGAPLWTYGQAGGYPANGSAVRNDKLWFDNSVTGETAFVTVLPDHSFWVGDIGNYRSLHISAARTYLEQVMYQPASYVATVDANDPTRVFNDFLEFKVDYSKPIGESWTLVRNWRAALGPQYLGFTQGLRQAATLANGRTYALVHNFSGDFLELVELGGSFLRPTGIRPAPVALGDVRPALMPDGSLYLIPNGPEANTTARWQAQALTGFDGFGNPRWAPPTTLASVVVGPQDPVLHSGAGDVQAPVTASGVLVSFDSSKKNGYHLGGIRVGGTKWLWKASPVGPLDGKGSYDIGNGVEYAGNTVMASGRHVVYGYHGEFWQDAQAGQHMHFYDDGLFVGQFGESNLNHDPKEGALVGSAGNGFSPCLVNVGGELYLWVNDEGGHGPQRWHLVGSGTVQEATGTGPLGTTVVLNAPPAAFPQQLAATPGDQQLGLSWRAVAGATGYIVRYALAPGGPYATALADTATTYTLANLTNGTRYFVSVAARLAGGPGPASGEVAACPYAPAALVQPAGQQASKATVYAVNSAAPVAGLPAAQLRQALRYEDGFTALPEVGRQGYVLFNWGGPGVDNANVRPPFTVRRGTGWRSDQFLKFRFDVDARPGNDGGLLSDPTGQITIGVADSKWHYLTVCSPVYFDIARHFTVSLAPQGQPGAAVRYTVSESPGLNHIFQFRFKGAVVLTVDNQGSNSGTLQAIFLDNDPLPSAVVPKVALTGFALVNADRAQTIKTIVSGETINLADLATHNLNIRANPGTAVGSVVFDLRGKQSKAATRNAAPYALFGDSLGQYNAWRPAVGTYTLQGTPFSASNGGGTAGPALTATFTVVDRPAPGTALYRLNAGGPKLGTPLGVFTADTAFWPVPGTAALATQPVAGTASGALYQSVRYGTNGVLRYALPVPDGQYTVVLHFAENVWSAAGQRVFDVALEGRVALANYDIYRKAGGFTATTETLAVAVTDGTLNVDFGALAARGGVDQPAVAAIEVLAATAPLPVTLTQFGAERWGPGALLTWATASEKDNAYFQVESSTDGRSFGMLAQVMGSGSAVQAQRYQFLDPNVARYGAPLVYYRLRQVDQDGTETFSPVSTLELDAAAPAAGLALQAWPSPLRPGEPLSLRIRTDEAGPAQLSVSDELGRSLWQQQQQLSAGFTTLALPEAARWPKGLYVLRVKQASRQQALKFVRE